MNTKKCCACDKEKDVSEFSTYKTKKDGLQAQCKVCHSAYRKRHYQANKQKYIDKARVQTRKVRKWWKEYKSTLSCSRCPENHPACLQFHHHNDDKVAGVASMVATSSREKILMEIAKCTVLCANCHFKEHWRD